jgi:tripartite-type tricarboxylate transporter receptor subunit TctC
MNGLRIVLLGILAVLGPFAGHTAARAAGEAYPAKPIQLIIPFAPGGSTDIMARLIATELSQRLGKQVVVENRSGAGSTIGSSYVARAKPDGYTLLFVSSPHAIDPAFYKLSYDPIKSFTPIARTAIAANLLAVNAGVAANSVQELIALARQKPGRLVAVSSGNGSSAHLAAELLKELTGIDFLILQFRGAGPAVVDLLGGHGDFVITSVVPLLPYLKSGQLRPLATTGIRRSDILPNVPTVQEQGIAGYDVTGWFGILAPAGVPKAIVDRLDREIKAALSSPDVQKRLLDLGAEAGYMDSAAFGPFIAEEVEKWGKVAKDANIKVQ